MSSTALKIVLEVTAYTAGYESTGKQPGELGYGITFSGAKVQQWRTAAAGPDIPLGTKLFISELADRPNGGIFTVEDRGGAISNAHLDIYMDSLSEARSWGRQHLEVLLWLPWDRAPAIGKSIEADYWRWRDKEALNMWTTKDKEF